MRIAVVGLGAVGGLLAARLAQAGHDVAALARGETLEKVRAHGLRLDSGGTSVSVPLAVSDDAASLGERELVVIAVKAPALAAAAPQVAPLIGADTVVLPAMNGVPW
jgi:2-dehydropantoate 2-reductase